MELSRQQLRRKLRPYGENVVLSVLGPDIPRRFRRSGGRYFANEAYRKLKGLPTLRHANPAATDFIIKQYKQHNTPSLPEVPGVEPENVGSA